MKARAEECLRFKLRLQTPRVPPLIVLLLAGCGAGSEGPTPAGELLTEAQTAGSRYISWKEHLIDDEELAGGVKLRGADGLQMADLDKDGHADIVSAHEDSSHIRIAFGSDDPDTWFRLSLAEGAEAAAVEDIAIGDLNGDGYPDVIAACENAHLLYLQNPGRTHNGTVRGWRWDRVIPRVTVGRGSFIRVFFADLNKDGRLEIVATNKGTGRGKAAAGHHPETEISWFEAPADPLHAEGWREHVLARVNVPINAQPVDLDADGDLDIFAGSRGEERVFWFENLSGDEIAFQQHTIDVDASKAHPERLQVTGFNLAFQDFSGDGRPDVVLSDTPMSVAWLEQPADPLLPWKVHPIGSIGPDTPAGIALADLNGDGQPDVMVGGYSRGPRDEDGDEVTGADPVGRLAWFANPGPAGGAWQRHDISRRKRGMFDAFVPYDIDHDGDIDLIATRGNSGEYDGVFWLEQRHSDTPVKVFEPARGSESQPLPLPKK